MGYSPETEEVDVARVEEILDAACARNPAPSTKRTGRPTAAQAALLCACISEDAPTWLIYKTEEDALVWQRVPSGTSLDDLVVAQTGAGGHVSPKEVRRWLEGEDDPWSTMSDLFDDRGVLPELARRIRGA